MSSNWPLWVTKKKTFIMLDFHHRVKEEKFKFVPVHPAGNINVIHEALYVQRQIGGVGAHQPLQFLALLVQPQQSPRVLPHI